MLLAELAGPAETLLNRHLEVAKVWYPHEAIPFDIARNFKDDSVWRPEDYPLPAAVRSAIYVNLLTEDNLPYYSPTIINQANSDHPLFHWGHRWTAEEGRHAIVMREWVHATRAIDPKLLEDGRMVQMGTGEVPQPESLADMLIYTSLQELATRVAHSNTGRLLGSERGGDKVMSLVAGDEFLHFNFYSGLAAEGFKVDPSVMVIAAFRQIRHFEMPGTGIPGFREHSKAIADAGIYDIEKFLNLVLLKTLEKWNFDSLTGLNPEAEKAYAGIQRHVALLGRVVIRQQSASQN